MGKQIQLRTDDIMKLLMNHNTRLIHKKLKHLCLKISVINKAIKK